MTDQPDNQVPTSKTNSSVDQLTSPVGCSSDGVNETTTPQNGTLENETLASSGTPHFSFKAYAADNLNECENSSLYEPNLLHGRDDEVDDIILEDYLEDKEEDMDVDGDGDTDMKENNEEEEDEEERDEEVDVNMEDRLRLMEIRNDSPRTDDDTSTLFSSNQWEDATTVYDEALQRNETEEEEEFTQIRRFDQAPIFEGSSEDDQAVCDFYMETFMYYNCFDTPTTDPLSRELRKNLLQNILTLNADDKLFVALLMNEFTNDMAYYTKQTFKLMKKALKREKQVKEKLQDLILKHTQVEDLVEELNKKLETTTKKISDLTLLISHYRKDGERSMARNLIRLELEYGCQFFIGALPKFKLSPTVDFKPFQLVQKVSERIGQIVTINHVRDIPEIMQVVEKAEKFMETGYDPLNI